MSNNRDKYFADICKLSKRELMQKCIEVKIMTAIHREGTPERPELISRLMFNWDLENKPK